MECIIKHINYLFKDINPKYILYRLFNSPYCNIITSLRLLSVTLFTTHFSVSPHPTSYSYSFVISLKILSLNDIWYYIIYLNMNWVTIGMLILLIFALIAMNSCNSDLLTLNSSTFSNLRNLRKWKTSFVIFTSSKYHTSIHIIST